MSSKRICEGFSKPPWPTLKHHQFSCHIPKKLYKSLREIRTQDKKGEFNQERLFRAVAKISISRTPNGLVEMDFADDGEGVAFPPLTRYIRPYIICLILWVR